MACANRTEIIRKAILNCSANLFDPSRSFVFHILSKYFVLMIVSLYFCFIIQADLVDPIRTSNGSILLFGTFTTNK